MYTYFYTHYNQTVLLLDELFSKRHGIAQFAFTNTEMTARISDES